MQFTDHYCWVQPDIRLHYLDEGQGPTLLFVTGFSGTAAGFGHQIEYFSKRFRVIAVEPRNHGLSSYCGHGNSYEQQGRDLGVLIDKLGLHHIVLAGWSFGALTALNYLEQSGADKVDAFVTIDNPPCPIMEDPSEYRAGDLDMLRDFHFHSFRSEEGFIDFVTKNFIDGIFFIHPPKDPAVREELLHSCLRLSLEVGDQLIVDGHMSDKRRIMKEVDAKIPCLFYVAEYRKEQGMRCLPRDYPHSTVVTLGNHMMFAEYPNEFNRLLEDFLQQAHLLAK